MYFSRKTLFLVGLLPVLQILSCRNDVKFCSNFFNIKQNHRYVRNTIKQAFLGSALTCSHKCLQEKNCVSFNYQTRGKGKNRMCELNDQAANFDSSDLSYDSSYDYCELENVSDYIHWISNSRQKLKEVHLNFQTEKN